MEIFFDYEKLIRKSSTSLDTNDQKQYILIITNANKAGLNRGRSVVVLTPLSIPTPAHPSGVTDNQHYQLAFIKPNFFYAYRNKCDFFIISSFFF